MCKSSLIPFSQKHISQNITDIKERNKQILKAIDQGYSQHRIAKVLGLSQPAVYGVIKRSGE